MSGSLLSKLLSVRESSFNMTWGDEDVEGDSENLYTSKPLGGGGSLKIEPLVMGGWGVC